jgi:hypothetical protein
MENFNVEDADDHDLEDNDDGYLPELRNYQKLNEMIDMDETCFDIDLQDTSATFEEYCNEEQSIRVPSVFESIWNGPVGTFARGITWMSKKLPTPFVKCIHFFIRFFKPTWFYAMQRTAYVCMVALGIIFTRNHIPVKVRDVILKLVSLVFGLIGCSDFFPSTYHRLLSRFDLHKQLKYESDKYFVLCSSCGTTYKYQDCLICASCNIVHYNCTCLCVKCKLPHHTCVKEKQCKKEVSRKQYRTKVCEFKKFPNHSMQRYRSSCNSPLLVRVKLNHSTKYLLSLLIIGI